MKGAFPLAVAVCVSIGTGFLGTGSTARAEKKVVVEQFSGPSGDKLRGLVQTALGKIADVGVIADKKVAQTEADLGLLSVADAYAAVGKQLGNAAFVGGSVSTAKKPRGKIVVKGTDGTVLGEASWTGDNSNKLMAAVGADVQEKLAGILGNAKGGGAVAAVAVAEPAPKKAEPVEASKKKAKADEDEWDKKDEKKATAAKADDAADKKPEEASVSASASTDEAEDASSSSDFLKKGLTLTAGVHIYSRNFSYNQNLAGGQQAYKLPAVPALAIGAEYFLMPWLGLTGRFEYTMAVISEDKAGDRYATKAFAWNVGVKPRVQVGPLEVNGQLGYGSQVFKIVPQADDGNPPKVAAVDNRAVNVGAGVRFPVTSSLALVAGGAYLHILSAGEILDDSKYFLGKAKAGEGYLGAIFGLPFVKGLDARVTLDVRRVSYAFDVLPGEPRVAGGAVDQYLGLGLGVGFSLGQ